MMHSGHVEDKVILPHTRILTMCRDELLVQFDHSNDTSIK